MNSPSCKSRLFTAGIGLLLLSGVPTSVWAETSCRADIVFSMDNTGSMGGIISSTKRAARKILDRISGGDPRFKGIDVQFAVTTYWGDPREHSSGTSGPKYAYAADMGSRYSDAWLAARWICGPTPSYPTRGTSSYYESRFKTFAHYRRYRCDYYTPADPSDDKRSLCRKYYGERSCAVPTGTGTTNAYVTFNYAYRGSRAYKPAVVMMSGEGKVAWQWDGSEHGVGTSGLFTRLADVATDKSGNIYVVDEGAHKVRKFTPPVAPSTDPKQLTEWGSYGSANGQFSSPWGITVDKDDNVWVVDSLNHRIQKFDTDGTHLGVTVGSLGSGTSEFNQPKGIASDASGNIYVADYLNHRIQKFASDGTYISKIKPGLSKLRYPMGIEVTPDNPATKIRDETRIYVKNRTVGEYGWVSSFKADGKYLKKFAAGYASSRSRSAKPLALSGISVGWGGRVWSIIARSSLPSAPKGRVSGRVRYGQISQRYVTGQLATATDRWSDSPRYGSFPKMTHQFFTDSKTRAQLSRPVSVHVVGGEEDPVDTSGGAGSATAVRKAYRVNQQLTKNKSKVVKAMGAWAPCSSPGGCGGDWEEANLFALHQIATEGGPTDGKGYSDPTTGAKGTNTDKGVGVCSGSVKTGKVDLWYGVAVEDDPIKVGSMWDLDSEARKKACDHALGWRDEAGRVVVWFGDAPSHNSTVTREEAINALNARGIVVAGINTGGKNRYMDSCHNLRTGSFGWGSYCGRSGYSKVGDPTAVAEATKGTMNHNVKGDARVIDAILKGVSAGIAQAGSQAMVSFGENKLTSSVHMYVSKFDAKGWTGDLEAWALNKKTGLPGSMSWSAAAEMDKKGKKKNAYSSFKDGGAHGGFRLDWGQCQKHSACKNDFDTAPTGSSDSAGESRLNWLLGDTSKDGSPLRKRKGLMGDIWHSSPVYVGASGGPWWDGMAYVKEGHSFKKFQKKVAKRKPVVYVGSNGGPLHAFDAKDGKELFAYYPRSLFNSSSGAGYHHLSDPRFAHKQVYVDGTAVVNDVVLNNKWQTVLVGTLANGGRGIFALNITDPEKFAVGGDVFQPYLWEFTNEDDPHFGYSQGKPTIALMNSGDWAVLVGNGPDGTASDEDAGTSQLFILKLSGPGPDGVWDLGRDYGRITTGMGETRNRNGGFSPQTVDLNGDGTIDRAYMGDLYSHIWAFDLTSTDLAKWQPAYGDKPLFSGMTEDDDLHTQPITARPLVTRAPRSVTKWIAGSVSAPPAATRRVARTTTAATPAPSGPTISLSFSTGPSTPAVSGSSSRSSPSPSGFASTGELTPGKTGDGKAPTIMRATGCGSEKGKLVGDGLMIYFGTGRFLSSADKTLTYEQFFYGVHDRGIPDRGVEHLVAQRFMAGGGEGGRITDPDLKVNYSKKSGWYIRLPEAGERVIDRAVVRGNLIMFNTLVPDASVCASGGHGWEMSVMNHNGGSPRLASWDFDGDGVIGVGDRGTMTTSKGEEKKVAYSGKKIEGKGLPSGSTVSGDVRFTPSSGADSPIATVLSPSTALPPHRLSWVELQPRN